MGGATAPSEVALLVLLRCRYYCLFCFPSSPPPEARSLLWIRYFSRLLPLTLAKVKLHTKALACTFLNRYLCSDTSPSFITALIHLPSYESHLDFIQSMGKRHAPSLVKAYHPRSRRSRGLRHAPEAPLDATQLHRVDLLIPSIARWVRWISSPPCWLPA